MNEAPAHAGLALVALAIVPLLAAMVAVVAPRLSGWLSVLAVLGVGVALGVLVLVLGKIGPVVVHAGGWRAPLGIALRADGLALAFATMSALVMAAVFACARGEFAGTRGRGAAPPETRRQWAFWPLALLLWSSLNIVFLSRDLFNLYVALELLTVVALALVAISGEARALAAALRYLGFALGGSLLYLLGTALLYAGHGTLDLALIEAGVAGRAQADMLAAGLITAGLAAKTALFPLHAWLAPAHAGAPAPASAMLSGLVPKASFVIILRVWFEPFAPLATPWFVTLMASMGAAAILYGSVLALRQTRLKQMIAYSTVAQIGYLFLIFPLAGGDGAIQPWAGGAFGGVIFHALSHGLAKAAMFLCAGLWIMAAGDDRIVSLRGLGVATPIATGAFALAAITLAGLPPSGGFTAKYLLLTSAFASGQIVWAGVVLAGGLLSAAYLYRPLACAFAAPDDAGGHSAPIRPVPRALQAVPLALALAAIALGIGSQGPFAFIQIGKPASAAAGL